MGFPEQGWGGIGFPGTFLAFKSYVDGMEVKTQRSEETKEVGPVTTHWWTKEVDFQEGEFRVIRDVYEAKPGHSSDSSTWFRYTLGTGASWKGQIGVAEIVVTLAPIIRKEEMVWGHPKGYEQSSNEFRWHFKDFEPGLDGAPREVFLRWE